MGTSFFRRDIGVYLRVKSDQPDSVSALDRRESHHRGETSGDATFLSPSSPKTHISARVHQDQDGELSLFSVDLDMRLACPRGHVPVDGSRVISWRIHADLIKGHAPTFEDRLIMSSHLLINQTSGEDLDSPYLSDELA
jgi:hypothetical protein